VSLSSSAESAFYEKQFLSVETETYSIFIHTNKASYRPGDVCKYRIIIVDSDTRPVAIYGSLTVTFFDSSKTSVHIKANRSAKKGIFSGEYQTPVRGKKGVWELEAEYKGKRVRKKFEITKTERPNFQVVAKTPNFVSNSSTQFSVGVECYYSFGKPITGTAVIKATPILQSNGSWTETAKPVTIMKDVRGSCLATFLMSSFRIPKMPTCDSILIETMVQEKATGAVVRGHDKSIPMDCKKIPSKYDILLSYFGFFLAGQMYTIKVQVRAKNGAALPADMQSIKFAVAFDSEVTEASTFTSYDLDSNGKNEIIISVPANTMTKIHFKVKHGESFEEATVMAKTVHVQVMNPFRYVYLIFLFKVKILHEISISPWFGNFKIDIE
jgi:MG2 domain